MATQKFIIPTGFETQQQKIASKQALQKALLGKALEGTPTNATSWAQVLAPIINGLLAGRMSKGIERDNESLRESMLGSYKTTMEEAQKDFENTGDLPGQMSRSEFVSKWGSNPFAATLLESVSKGMDSAQTAGASWKPEKMELRNGPDGTSQVATVLMNNRGQSRPMDPGVQLPADMTNVNGVAMNKDLWQHGQILPPSADASVVRTPDGGTAANPQALQAAAIRAGTMGLPPTPGIPPVSAYLGGPQAPAQPPVQTPQKLTPIVGQIEDGFRYIGGDPADPASWEKVQ